MDEVRLLKENKSYTRYKKGTIIYVKLGVNVGREFSGNHFCMVLNNHDSNKNPILTVVPLTSSRSKFNVHIEEDLLPLVLEKMDVTGKDLAKKS
ncbi:type II toxin-antitoxin system PemK/MazF family toxin [Staphylococcus aureus]|nr:type II toxin-antitoxin system PemK/MazF family toxin [Staphylococcus aureus]